MKVWAGINGEGISLRVSDEDPKRLEPSASANQTAPRHSYVYGHFDEAGRPFYIGKGNGRRAWDDSRHQLWHRYVERHLGGHFTVRILADDLTPEQAEELEGAWIAQEGEGLVNWINFGRKTDLDTLDKYHALRDANVEFIGSTRAVESTDPERAVAAYYQAIESIAAYATLQTESGLIGNLLQEEGLELGYSGELEALDRLTLCLVRLGRGAEARAAAEAYFAKYRADLHLRTAERIQKRVTKAAKSGG